MCTMIVVFSGLVHESILKWRRFLLIYSSSLQNKHFFIGFNFKFPWYKDQDVQYTKIL